MNRLVVQLVNPKIRRSKLKELVTLQVQIQNALAISSISTLLRQISLTVAFSIQDRHGRYGRSAPEGGEHHESRRGVPREIWVLAVAQWILWYGQSLFKQVLFQGEVSLNDLRAWRPGPLYKGKANLSLDRWHFWRDGYSAMASSRKEEEKGYSEECRDVAAKAAGMMDALERNMTF